MCSNMHTQMRNQLKRAAAFQALIFSLTALAAPASGAEKLTAAVQEAVNAVIPDMMSQNRIPGMAVAVTINGKAYSFYYGLASVKARAPVTGDTLFEIGSITKTFTATLASWAQVQQRLSLSDSTETYLPQLRNWPFGKVTLLSLGTHTPGGLPLQFPNGVASDASLLEYFKKWRPTYSMDTHRTYTNQGIGMLGFITAKSMGVDFRSLMQQRLIPALGLQHSYIEIPASKRGRYAWGYTDKNKPIRAKAGTLEDETYGIKTTAADMIQFVQMNINPSELPASLRKAITQTHTGYFHAGSLTQDLIWEQYPYPTSLQSLLDGNSYKMFFEATPVVPIVPPQQPTPNVWINKTGSTNGFGAYVAFIPAKRIGIVLLANKNYPIPDRVGAAYKILSALKRANVHEVRVSKRRLQLRTKAAPKISRLRCTT